MHKKELRRSDFLFDGGYVGAKAPLLSTSKNKINFHRTFELYYPLTSVKINSDRSVVP